MQVQAGRPERGRRWCGSRCRPRVRRCRWFRRSLVWMLANVGSRFGVGPAIDDSFSSQAARPAAAASSMARTRHVVYASVSSRAKSSLEMDSKPDARRRVSETPRRCDRLVCARSGLRAAKPVTAGVTSLATSVDAILREVVGQRPLADAHQLGGVLLHAAGAVERAADRLASRPIRCSGAASATAGRPAAASPRRAPTPTRVVMTRPGRQHDRPLDRVLELADVARPVVLLQRRRARRRRRDRCGGRCAARASGRSARPAAGCLRGARAAAGSRSG